MGRELGGRGKLGAVPRRVTICWSRASIAARTSGMVVVWAAGTMGGVVGVIFAVVCGGEGVWRGV